MEIPKAKCAQHRPRPVCTSSVVKFMLISDVCVK